MTKGLSDQMYHRVFRLVRRGVDNHAIAATLGLPLKTVENLVSRFKNNSSIAGNTTDTLSDSPGTTVHTGQSHLDFFIFAKTRFVEVDVNGDFIIKNIERIDVELSKINASDWKTVAFKMSGVKEVDEAAMELLLTFHREFLKRGRYSGILDPSPTCETFLEKHDKISIPVFGTEAAFEENAFTLKAPTIRK